MKLTRANAKAIKYACMKFHYAKACENMKRGWL